MKLFFALGIAFSLVACSGSKSQPTTDSVKTTADTTSQIGNSKPQTDQQEDLDIVLKDIVSTMKSKGDLSTLNKYVYPGVGFYEYYLLPDMNTQYDHMENIALMNGDEANGPGPDAYVDFETQLGKINSNTLNINYNFPDLHECTVTQMGVFGVKPESPFDMISSNFSNRAETNGTQVDAEELAKLKKMESLVTDKIILNLWDNKEGSQTKVLCFGKVDKKYYLFILNLTNFCDNE
jgi:hypothetical protein